MLDIIVQFFYFAWHGYIPTNISTLAKMAKAVKFHPVRNVIAAAAADNTNLFAPRQK
jgi:hypothetical protein